MCLFNPINTICWAITVIRVYNDIVTFSDWVLTVIWTVSYSTMHPFCI